MATTRTRTGTQVGFLRSNGIAKNLRFDTSVLNQLIDDSPGLSFKDVRVDHLSFQLSYCSFPALTIGVRGVHVTLSGGELKEERRLTPRDTYSEDMKKILALIDPEGTALHDMLERISGTTLSRNSLTTSFLNVILNHCRLEIHDIHMQVQFSMSTDSFGCLFEMKELSMESQYLKHGCLLKGLVGALFAPLKRAVLLLMVEISEDKMFSNSVKHNWNVISEIEKELPAEAIAQARRIARYRAALNVQHAGDVTSSSAMEDLVGESSSRNSFGLRDLDPGLWSCCLTVGKLNFSLGYSSILSVALLCKQIQHALCWAKDNGKSRVISHSPETIEDLPETNLSSRYKFLLENEDSNYWNASGETC
ncbi:hypothetical protein CK203_111287 [Vitis vinifera]|uniref:Uncharacterized protein n=1 Tax=Vitis vinifera TaxID=29760 RepID=A0A438FBC2_VITVI|nr:hypothetical protein CK203_111287 [Vitis vinifera]